MTTTAWMCYLQFSEPVLAPVGLPQLYVAPAELADIRT